MHKSTIPFTFFIAVAALPGLPGATLSSAPARAAACESVSSSNGLAAAKAAFARACPGQPRRDCDPLPGGGWLCSSGTIGARDLGRVGRGAPTPLPTASATPTRAPTAARAPAPTPAPTPVASGACEVSTGPSGSLADARSLYARRCAGVPRQDCDPLAGGGWACSSAAIGAPVRRAAQPAVAPSAPARPVAPVRARGAGRLSRGDLLVLHYDNCPDRDDGHAMAAGYTVTDRLGLDPLVVNGTCGNAVRSRYQSASAKVARATFGSTLNASTAAGAALSRSAAAWASALANGDDVWVAEGGPSDFTALVLRALARDYPQLDRRRVHVVQHSDWNERHTDGGNLRFVKGVTDYIRIQDGNRTNATADLNGRSSRFVSQARSSRYASAWNAAFDYMSPGRRLDFSDTVELLHIVGDSATRDPDGFAARYLR